LVYDVLLHLTTLVEDVVEGFADAGVEVLAADAAWEKEASAEYY
jgi:hypothetical protein